MQSCLMQCPTNCIIAFFGDNVLWVFLNFSLDCEKICYFFFPTEGYVSDLTYQGNHLGTACKSGRVPSIFETKA